METSNPELVHAHFFFVDVVGLSNPSNSTKIQLKKLNILHNCIKECKTFKESKQNEMLLFPSGDGMSIGFFKGPNQPLHLSIELHEQLSKANKGGIPAEVVEVRIGLNSGNAFYVEGVFGDRTIWGPGIILARRVMDFGDSGHILMTGTMAEDLSELSDNYKRILHKIEDLVIKHGKSISIYSVYGDSYGNPNLPQKIKQQGVRKEFARSNEDTLYPKIRNEITVLDPKTMLVHHKRIYAVLNTGEKPIKYVLQGIGTDVKKNSLDDLRVKVFDEDNKEMEIDFLTMNYPYQKEFTTKFNRPLMKHDLDRRYTLEYEEEEPEHFFENFFQVGCDHFELSFIYQIHPEIKEPILYDVDPETDIATKSKIVPTVEKKNGKISLTWTIKNIHKGSVVRIEW